VGLDVRPNVQKHLRSEEPSDPQAPEQAPALEAPALANPNSGTQRSLVILVQFPDQASLGSTPAQWNSKFFGATNSVQDYYDEVSHGQLNIAPATESHGTANDGVVGWLTMSTNHPNTAGNTGTANRTLARDAVIAADPSVNYASYDSNGDGFLSSRELHVTVIVAGQEAAGWSHLGKSAWGHAWSLFGTERPTVDGVVFGDSGHGGGYTQFGEWHGDHMATIGIMAHEMGHDLYLPDLYDTDLSSEGVGNWSVMGTGVWLAVSGAHQGSTPAHLDAWSKSYEGWLTPQRLSGTQGIAQAETNATAMQLRDNPGGVDWTFTDFCGDC
jgi:M6 family metalloprotease-like protein